MNINEQLQERRTTHVDLRLPLSLENSFAKSSDVEMITNWKSLAERGTNVPVVILTCRGLLPSCERSFEIQDGGHG